MLQRKLTKASAVLQQEGLRRVFRLVLLNLLEDRWLLGKLAGARGSTARLDGMVFSLESPHIDTKTRSRFLLGTYESEARYLIKKHLPGDLPVVELGGCVGVVSCTTNAKLENPEAHVVVEANANLLPLLRTNRDANGCRFKIIHAALGYAREEIVFYFDERFNGGSTRHVTNESITVPAVSLQAILEQAGFERAVLICDIEGSERELVEAEANVLRDRIAWLVMEIHGNYGESCVHSALQMLGFEQVDRFDHNILYRNVKLKT